MEAGKKRPLEEAMLGLSDLPQRCSIAAAERLSQMGYKKLMVKDYVIFFSVDEKNQVVDVDRILNMRRDWLGFLLLKTRTLFKIAFTHLIKCIPPYWSTPVDI